MSAVTEAVLKVAESTEAAFEASAWETMDALRESNKVLIQCLKLIAMKIDGHDYQIVQGIADAGQAIDDIEAMLCKCTDRIEVLESKDSQTTTH